MSGYPTIRADGLITATYDYALGATTSQQISGGIATLAALGGKVPSTVRQSIIICNPPTSVGLLFISTVSTVTSTGVKAFAQLAPGQMMILAINGLFPLWILGSLPGTLSTVLEVQ